MANFRSSFWYHIYVNTDKSHFLAATNLFFRNGTMGAVRYNSDATQNATRRWQWYGINSTTYVLRCEESGPDAFLGTKNAPNVKVQGHTQVVMVGGNVINDSVYWTVSPWGDGTFFMTNKENGTDWHLEERGSRSVAMSSNITVPQDGQRWSFMAIEEINDDKFSTISLPSQSTSSPPTNTNLIDSTQATTSSLISPPSGLSTGAKAGVGAGIGSLALLAFVALVFFLLRRRKQKNTADPHKTEQNNEIGGGSQELGGVGKYEMGNEGARHEIAQGESVKYGQRGEDTAYEMPIAYEMPAAQVTAALPSSTVGAHA